jgi:hypothetical protein
MNMKKRYIFFTVIVSFLIPACAISQLAIPESGANHDINETLVVDNVF